MFRRGRFGLRRIPMIRIRQWFIHLSIFLAISILITGCGSVKIVANHDPAIEKGVTDLQKKVESVLTKIQKSQSDPSATYDANTYEQIQEDINVLRTRAAAWDKNTQTVKMLDELAAAILENPTKSTETASEKTPNGVPPVAHFSIQARNKMKDPMGPEDIKILRTLVESHFRSILRFELLKQRT